VYPLVPHDVDVMLESVGADLVLIEAAAMLAGSPWAYAGDPAATDRGRRLGRLIAAARAQGKPVVFIRNVPAHLAPGLDWVAASCDAVSDDGFGVQLARFNPIGLAAERPADPVFAGARDPRQPPAVRALLDTLTGPGGPVTMTGEIGWRRRPGLYREHAVFLSVSAGQAREQQASGARVVLAGGGLPAVREQLEAAQAEPPRAGADAFGPLRDIFTEHATPARLAALAARTGLPAHLVSGRQIAVLALVPDADAAAGLAASVSRQRLAPAELIAVVTGRPGGSAEAASHAVTAALSDLAARGVSVTAVPGTGPGWLAQAARTASAPWVAPWPSDHAPDSEYLLDLACARESAQADAVGFAGSRYAYVTSLEPALARREHFSPDGPGHGLRLFSVS
jgi:hypothetical protein